MSILFRLFRSQKFAKWLVASLLLLACQLPARAQVTITTASLSQLLQALSFSSTTSTQTVICAFNGTITLNSSVVIAGNIILEAQTNFNVTIKGASGKRIFQVQPSVNFTVANLILSGGDSAGTNGGNGTAGSSGSKGNPGTSATSGANGFGGAIFNLGTNTAINCIFLTNSATGGNGGIGGAGGNGSAVSGGNGGSGGSGGAALGGAICNLGTLLLSNCTFAGNGAIAGNGGAGGTNGTGGGAFPGAGGVGGPAAGAGLYNVGRATIQNCTFDFNFCQAGNSQTAGGTPGGNGNGPAGPAGGTAEGAGIYNVHSGTTNNSMSVLNCTFASNLAGGGAGGNGGQALNGGLKAGAAGNGGNAIGAGIFNDTGGSLTITNCTFVSGSVFGGTNGNVGSVGFTTGVSTGTIGAELGGNIANVGTLFTLKNSILTAATNGGNIYGAITDQGFNLSDDATPSPKAATTITNTDPMLFPLATNGGPTQTFDLEPGSPAIDAITGTMTNVDFPAFDQRGFPRPLPVGGRADIGAVEHGNPAFNITGTITPPGVANYTNIVINAVGSGVTYTTMPTNALGGYAFLALPPDTYTITPQTTNGFSFSPVNQSVIVTNQNESLSNFVATRSYLVGGLISNLTSAATVVLYVTNNGNNTQYAQTTTGTNGVYTFTNVPNGNYLIVPQQTSSTGFTPISQLVTNLLADSTNFNFSAGLPTFQIAGQILNTGGVIISVQASSTVSASTTTDASGNYSFNVVQGSYTITPQPTNGLTFTPSSRLASVPPATNLDTFTAISSSATYNLTGVVSNLHSSITITAVSGTNSHTTSSDATTGVYTFTNLPSASYTLTPQAVTGVSFTPSAQPVVLTANTNAVPFVAAISNYTISGHITIGAKAYSNIVVIANGTNIFNSTNSYSAQSDTSGAYNLANLPAATYIVSPQPSAFFTPSNKTVPLPAGPAAGIDFSLISTNSSLVIVHLTNSPTATIAFGKWVPNSTYRIQASTNFTSWQDLFTNTPGTNSTSNTVSLTPITNRFFRAVTP